MEHLSDIPRTKVEEKPKTDSLRGREAISIEAALAVQITLMRKMIPERLQQLVTASDGEHVSIEDELFMQWHEKYAPHFAEYCDLHGENPELISRIQNEQLTENDFQNIRMYLEDKSNGGIFFTEQEEDVFIRSKVH